MNAEALIGTTLGSCVLQQLLGRGTMGVVYLAQQSRPQRQVAVKIFLQAATLERADQADFLVHLQREIDTMASLKHPDIVAIYECGEHNGVPYLVTPYIAGGTLQALLNREGALPLPMVASYLKQLCTILDFAHEHGILHRDIKPANILFTTEDHLQLTDFALTKVMAEGKLARVRLPLPGMLDYMAPEHVLGRPIDARADIYALGAVLYHMVTGQPPFRGDTLTDVAMKQVQTPPRSPRSLRSDLPLAAEQALMRALAKRPADRYAHARDLASAFDLALSAAGITDIAPMLPDAPPSNASTSSGSTGSLTRLYTRRGLFDPQWQTNALPSASPTAKGQNAGEAQSASLLSGDTFGQSSAPAASHEAHSAFKKLALQPEKETQAPPVVRRTIDPATPVEQQPFMLSHFHTKGTLPLSTDALGNTGAALPDISDAPQTNTGTFKLAAKIQPDTGTFKLANQTQISTGTLPSGTPATQNQGTTGNLPLVDNGAGDTNTAPFQFQPAPTVPGSQENTGATSTIKLTSPVKIIQVPVAGQPGRFMTGFLPVLPAAQPEQAAPQKPAGPLGILNNKRLKIIGAILVVALILVSSGIFWLARPHTNPAAPRTAVSGTPNVAATATVQASATAEANIILSDPLSQRFHNLPVTTSGPVTYIYKDGAYHITNNQDVKSAPALLPDEVLTRPFSYTLTMEEIKGDDTNVNNEFGLMLRATTLTKNGQQFTMFYSFEVANKPGGDYQFWEYDGSQTGTAGPWKELWHHPFGREFHQGHGPGSINTFKVHANGKNFTLIVNGKQVGTLSDGAIASGMVGMLVNLKGTEVAFSNLLLTYN